MAKKNLVKFLIISWSLILGIKETNAKEDIIYNIHKENFSFESIDGGRLNLSDFEGKVISKSTLYKSLKSLCEKKIISHLGSSRSCIYKFN